MLADGFTPRREWPTTTDGRAIRRGKLLRLRRSSSARDLLRVYSATCSGAAGVSSFTTRASVIPHRYAVLTKRNRRRRGASSSWSAIAAVPATFDSRTLFTDRREVHAAAWITWVTASTTARSSATVVRSPVMTSTRRHRSGTGPNREMDWSNRSRPFRLSLDLASSTSRSTRSSSRSRRAVAPPTNPVAPLRRMQVMGRLWPVLLVHPERCGTRIDDDTGEPADSHCSRPHVEDRGESGLETDDLVDHLSFRFRIRRQLAAPSENAEHRRRSVGGHPDQRCPGGVVQSVLVADEGACHGLSGEQERVGVRVLGVPVPSLESADLAMDGTTTSMHRLCELSNGERRLRPAEPVAHGEVQLGIIDLLEAEQRRNAQPR